MKVGGNSLPISLIPVHACIFFNHVREDDILIFKVLGRLAQLISLYDLNDCSVNLENAILKRSEELTAGRWILDSNLSVSFAGVGCIEGFVTCCNNTDTKCMHTR